MAVGIIIRRVIEFDNSLAALFADVDNRSCRFSNIDGTSDFESFPWTDQALPTRRRNHVDAQNFARSIIGKKTCRNDSRVVHHEQIVFPDKVREFGELPVLDRAGSAINDHHTGLPSPLGRALGNEFVRKIVIKIAGAHLFLIAEKHLKESAFNGIDSKP